MATHSSVLAWRIPGTGEPGGPPSMGSHRVGHDWSDLAAAAAAKETQSHFHWIHTAGTLLWYEAELENGETIVIANQTQISCRDNCFFFSAQIIYSLIKFSHTLNTIWSEAILSPRCLRNAGLCYTRTHFLSTSLWSKREMKETKQLLFTKRAVIAETYWAFIVYQVLWSIGVCFISFFLLEQA